MAIIVDYLGDDATVTVHDDSVATEYADWGTAIAAVPVNTFDGKNCKDNRGSWDGRTSATSVGTAPLTAMPAVGVTQRAAGQGCTNCLYRGGCQAVVGRRRNLSDDCGTRCSSYVAG